MVRVRLLVCSLAVFMAAIGCTATIANAEPNLESDFSTLEAYLEKHANYEEFVKESNLERTEIDHALSDQEWLEQLYKSPSAAETESEIEKLDTNDQAKTDSFVKTLDTQTEEIPLDSPLEEELGGSTLETAESAGILTSSFVTPLVLAATAGELIRDDVTTGSNPATEFLVELFGGERPEESASVIPGPAERPSAERVRLLGNSYAEFKELYGENAEELGLCVGERDCLRYVYPWEFVGDSAAGCGESVRYCGESENTFGKAPKFQEGSYEVIEVYDPISGREQWTIESALWYRDYERRLVTWYEEPFHIPREELLEFRDIETPPNEFSLYPVEEDCPGSPARYLRGWPIYVKGFFMLLGGPTDERGYEYPWGDGNSCEGEVKDYTSAVGVSSVGEVSVRGTEIPSFIGLPGMAPLEASKPKPVENPESEKGSEVRKNLTKKNAIKKAPSEYIKHATEGGPEVQPNPTAPECSSTMTGTECAEEFAIAGFTHVEVDPLTWQHAVVSLPANAFVSQSIPAHTMVPADTDVKIEDNPAAMPAVVPSYPGDVVGTDYATKLGEEGWTDTEISVVPEPLIDTSVGPNDVIRTSPAGGTLESPGSEPATKVVIVTNPSDAPPPEGHTPIGSPTEPGINFPKFGVLCKGFPFGVPCWLAQTIEGWSATSKAPEWGISSFTIEGHTVPGAKFNLTKLEPIMEVVRPAILVFATIGLVLLFYRFAKGGSPASGSGSDSSSGGSSDEGEN